MSTFALSFFRQPASAEALDGMDNRRPDSLGSAAKTTGATQAASRNHSASATQNRETPPC